jgi:hypothetical protein
MANSRLFWPTPEEARERQELMDQMMQVRGVDVAAASKADGGLAFREAIGKCRLCRDEGVCRQWLAGETRTTPHDFCPNADFFSTLLKKPD